VAHAGAITFRLTVPGRAAHASQRREGVSALDKLFVLAQALEADEARRNGAETDPLMTVLGLPYPTIIGIVSGGEWASTVLDRVVADGRYGVRLGQSAAAAEADLRAAIAAACADDDFLRDHPATVEITGGRFGSARVPSDHPLPVGLADVAERVMGRRPALLGEPYGADMQMFVNVGDTPCVMFGPGDVKVAHSADEHVPLAEVEACAAVLAAWVRQELVTG
jgi:acetylornithine deacetylase